MVVQTLSEYFTDKRKIWSDDVGDVLPAYIRDDDLSLNPKPAKIIEIRLRCQFRIRIRTSAYMTKRLSSRDYSI